ncbi:DUF1211 domain-containing protein [Pediococcus stilesii]|uniref:DUF1211 domain-containing protein n=1 Tax=Pediococcus stilesii TaxID=331679 RepID=A0A5R9BT59_9LACO|nr:TMEM175 family protein [Pediococcus stilesii]TLQ03797.1 DUF1211 domain-containing protein [Pediococcus stilesii]
MNKSRVEAFTDAVVAIIMTIMILEFKTPETDRWSGIIAEVPYLFAYIVSFIFIAVAWYNHHYMFAIAKRITKKIYWVNNFWIFTMSLLPVSTAWAGRYLNSRAPEYFYLVVFLLWGFAYQWLSKAIIDEHATKDANHVADRVRRMAPYRVMHSWMYPIMIIFIGIAVLSVPILGIISSLIWLIMMGILTTKDSDQLF